VSKFDAKECRIERDIVIQNWEKIKPFIEDHCQMPNCAIRDFCTCSFRIHVSEFVSSTPPQQIYFEIRRLLADIDRRNFWDGRTLISEGIAALRFLRHLRELLPSHF
jgi:hypothetical protein